MRNNWFWFLVMCGGMLYASSRGLILLTLIDMALASVFVWNFGKYDVPTDDRSPTNG